MQFFKVEGLGNDFVLVDIRDHEPAEVDRALGELRQQAPRLCDRRRGIGGDGILLVGPSVTAGADATMYVINHDGSRPQMCGNGLRCVAWYVQREATDAREMVRIDTDDGCKACRVQPHQGGADVEVDMGVPRDLGTQTPAAGAGRSFMGVSMGNPHAVAFVDDDETPEQLARELGPGLEVDPAYPERTNVEFARIEPGQPPTITLWVWERGVGITDACGTGACATAYAAVKQAKAPVGVPINVDLPGGRLVITVPEGAGVRMRGPARIVFAGRL